MLGMLKDCAGVSARRTVLIIIFVARRMRTSRRYKDLLIRVLYCWVLCCTLCKEDLFSEMLFLYLFRWIFFKACIKLTYLVHYPLAPVKEVNNHILLCFYNNGVLTLSTTILVLNHGL